MRVPLASLFEAEEVSFPLRLGEVETALLTTDGAEVRGDTDGANTQHPRAQQRE